MRESESLFGKDEWRDVSEDTLRNLHPCILTYLRKDVNMYLLDNRRILTNTTKDSE